MISTTYPIHHGFTSATGSTLFPLGLQWGTITMNNGIPPRSIRHGTHLNAVASGDTERGFRP